MQSIQSPRPSVMPLGIPVFLAVVLFAGCASPDRRQAVLPPTTPDAAPLQLERVVMLMRHGVRPPTTAQVTPEGYAREPWSTWDVPPGHLTAHGYQGMVLLGRWNRQAFSGRGLVPTTGCPDAGSVRVRTNTIQRTRESGRGFIEGFAPDCGLSIEHADGERNDPLFDTIDLGLADHDPDAARTAIAARVGGDIDSAVPPLAEAFARLDTILGCCGPPVCSTSGLPAGCGFADLSHRWQDTARKRVKLSGPLTIGGTAAQTLLLEYVEGKPMDQVGWGRASAADIELLSQIHAVEFDLHARTPYVSHRAAAPILERVLATFNDASAPRLDILVAHDTNASNVGGALDLHWHVPGYAPDDAAVGGAIGFELLRDPAGERFVRVFYQAQGTRQLRELQPLDGDNPPYVHYMEQPLCALPADPTRCRYDDFSAAAQSRIVH